MAALTPKPRARPQTAAARLLRVLQFVLALVLPAAVPPEARAAANVLRFAWLSDTHVGDATGEEDLRRTVRDLNTLSNLDFVVISGDVTQFGSCSQLLLAKSILDGLHIPCHVTPGNHDCKWSESGATDFPRIWGSDRFAFDAGACTFIGMHEGPVMKMGDGHFAPQDVRWLAATLAALPPGRPVIFVTHYPLRDELDNWFVVLDELKKYNVQAILVGHGHHNEKLDFEGVPAAMGRANLRLPHAPGGYNLVEIANGVLTLSERNPDRGTLAPWHTIRLEKHHYAPPARPWPRPDFSVNTNYPNVEERWRFDAKWTVASTPAVAGGRVFFGDGAGKFHALSLETGRTEWETVVEGAVYSSPAVSAGRVVFASTDGGIYAVRSFSGGRLWQTNTGRAIVASPALVDNVVYLGAGDGKFRALDASSGALLWEYHGIEGFVETRPLVTNNEVIFGAWDQHLYALDATTGHLVWKWKGQSPGDLGVMYSPAACEPVTAARKVFVVAPDRFMTALDFISGREIWRTNAWQVRESIGLSADGDRVYVRTMTNSAIVALATAPARPEKLWAMDTHEGYDINSAMLVEKSGVLYYGTKNGVLMAVDPRSGTLLWKHKLGVTVLNTVVPLDEPDEVIVADVDGKVTRVGPRIHSFP